MEQKTIQSQKVYYKTVKTNLRNIQKYVGALPSEIMEKATHLELNICGPQIWRYIGSDGNPETEFTLQVGLPVDGNTDKVEGIGEFEPFKCVTFIHEGSWADFGKAYQRIIGEVMVAGLKMSGETREIYHQVDFENETNNVTEIQIGIQ